MNWIEKLGEDCNYADYQQMLSKHELDGVWGFARLVVNQFTDQFPTVPIDRVYLTINKDATYEVKILTQRATAAEDCKIRIKSKEAEHEPII